VTVIDFHAHILPGADHGSYSVEDSLAQLKKAENVGVKTIVATSHYYIQDNTVAEFLQRRDEAYGKLKKAYKGKINIIKGAEVTLAIDIPEMEDLGKLCIEGTNCILIEMPTIVGGPWIFNALDTIKERGYQPIIAHVDRYTIALCEQLMTKDVIIQINASAISSVFTRKRMMNYLEQGAIHLLGSDVHDKEATQYDQFYKAVKKLGGYTTYLMNNAADILNLK